MEDDRLRRRRHDHDIVERARAILDQREHRPTTGQFGVDEILIPGDTGCVPAAAAQFVDEPRGPDPARTGEHHVAAYTLNELSDDARQRVEQQLLDRTRRGGRVLILEPLARAVAPWWHDMAHRMSELGGRADEWTLPVEVPPIVRQLGTAAGLNYRELRFQTLSV